MKKEAFISFYVHIYMYILESSEHDEGFRHSDRGICKPIGQVLDLDNDGLVSAEEVTAALKKLKMNMAPEQIVDILSKMKFDSDGMSALKEIMKGIETESEDQLEFGQNLWRAHQEERKVVSKEQVSASP